MFSQAAHALKSQSESLLRPSPGEPVPGSGRAGRIETLLLLAVLSSTLATVAFLCFPQDADGYLLLLLKEAGPQGVLAGHADRPLAAHVWALLARGLGDAFWPTAFVLHLAIWIALGAQTAAVWRHFFPDRDRYAILVGCLAVCPVVVRIQLSVVTVTLLGLSSTVLVYAGLLLSLRYIGRAGWASCLAGWSAAGVGVLLSEYGVAAAAPAVILLGLRWSSEADLDKRRRAVRAGAGFVAAVAVCYLVYQATRDTSLHPELDPLLPLRQPAPLLGYVFRLLTRLWHVLVGAYASAAGALSAEWDSKSSILSVAYACGTAAILILASRGDRSAEFSARRRGLFFFAALVAGLAPVVLMRNASVNPYASRFYIPVMPVAVSLTVLGTLTATRQGFRRGAVGLLGLIAGSSIISDSAGTYRGHRLLAEVGAALESQVNRSEALTVAVLSTDEFCFRDVLCTAAISARWPPEVSRKLWVYDPSAGRAQLGPRRAANPPRELRLDFRGIVRDGPVEQVLWIEIEGDKFWIEPYATGSAPSE
jgi:hypothetical protein